MRFPHIEKLQREIESATSQYNNGLIESIELDHGCEVTDLQLNVPLRVRLSNGSNRKLLIITKEFVQWVFQAKAELANYPQPRLSDVYTTGGPIAIVQAITADSIVRAVLRYFELEAARGD